MAALFVSPLAFSAASTSPAASVGTVANLNVDHPAMVWQSGLASYLIVDMGAVASYDTIALIGSNLRASDTVQIRTGTTTTGTGNYAGTAQVAFTGNKTALSSTESIYRLGSVRTERYVRIDITATGHPDGYVKFSRLVIGKAVSTLGIDFDAEMGFEDQSVITTAPSYTSVEEYDVLISWKFSTGWISEASWRADWYPMLQAVGSKKAILFIPNDATSTYWQSDAIFGRVISKASGKNQHFNGWRVDATIMQLAR